MIHGVTLFCEDVREERFPLMSIIGVMSDNLGIAEYPAVIPRIAFYTKALYSKDFSPKKPIRVMIHIPGAPAEFREQVLGEIPLDVIESGKESHTGLCGIQSYAAAVNFLVPEPGEMSVYLEVDGDKVVTGILNISPPFEAALQRDA